MNKMLDELRTERDQLDEAIVTSQRLAVGHVSAVSKHRVVNRIKSASQPADGSQNCFRPCAHSKVISQVHPADRARGVY